MKIKWKMSLLVLFMGLIFSSNLILFNTSLSYIESFREEKVKSLYLLNSWNELMTATQKLNSAFPILTVKSEWDRKVSEFDTQLSFFATSQIQKHNLSASDKHYQSLMGLQQIWQVIREKFTQISLSYETLDRETVPLTPLLTWSAIEETPKEVDSIINSLNEFYPFQSSFSSSLQDMLYLIDKDIEIKISQVLRLLVLAFMGITLLSLVLIFLYTQRLVNRFLLVEKAFSRISQGDFSGSLNIKGKDELGMLSNHFTQFMEVLRERLNSGIEIMHKVSESIKEGDGVEAVYSTVVKSAIELAGADTGILLIEKEGSLNPVAISGNFPPLEEISTNVLSQERHIRDYLLHSHYSITGDSLYSQVFKENKIFVLRKTEEKEYPFSIPEKAQYISSLIIVPLLKGQKTVGVMAIAIRKEGRFFSDIEVNHFSQFADFASITIENHQRYLEILKKQQMERDLDIAADIQKKLLPDPMPELNQIDIAAYTTAAKVMSGDYYDVVRLNNDRVAIIICDVAGKGIPAALVMVMIRSIFHIVVTSARDPQKIIYWLNRGLCGSLASGIFATLSVLMIDEKNKTLKYANAAHHPLLILDPEKNEIESMDANGLPVGLEENSRYGQKERKLKPGTLLALYTDGVNEAPNLKNQEFSAKKIQEILSENIDNSVQEIRDILVNTLKVHTRGTDPHDDQTMLFMKIR